MSFPVPRAVLLSSLVSMCRALLCVLVAAVLLQGVCADSTVYLSDNNTLVCSPVSGNAVLGMYTCTNCAASTISNSTSNTTVPAITISTSAAFALRLPFADFSHNILRRLTVTVHSLSTASGVGSFAEPLVAECRLAPGLAISTSVPFPARVLACALPAATLLSLTTQPSLQPGDTCASWLVQLSWNSIRAQVDTQPNDTNGTEALTGTANASTTVPGPSVRRLQVTATPTADASPSSSPVATSTGTMNETASPSPTTSASVTPVTTQTETTTTSPSTADTITVSMSDSMTAGASSSSSVTPSVPPTPTLTVTTTGTPMASICPTPSDSPSNSPTPSTTGSGDITASATTSVLPLQAALPGHASLKLTNNAVVVLSVLGACMGLALFIVPAVVVYRKREARKAVGQSADPAAGQQAKNTSKVPQVATWSVDKSSLSTRSFESAAVAPGMHAASVLAKPAPTPPSGSASTMHATSSASNAVGLSAASAESGMPASDQQLSAMAGYMGAPSPAGEPNTSLAASAGGVPAQLLAVAPQVRTSRRKAPHKAKRDKRAQAARTPSLEVPGYGPHANAAKSVTSEEDMGAEETRAPMSPRTEAAALQTVGDTQLFHQLKQRLAQDPQDHHLLVRLMDHGNRTIVVAPNSNPTEASKPESTYGGNDFSHGRHGQAHEASGGRREYRMGSAQPRLIYLNTAADAFALLGAPSQPEPTSHTGSTGTSSSNWPRSPSIARERSPRNGVAVGAPVSFFDGGAQAHTLPFAPVSPHLRDRAQPSGSFSYEQPRSVATLVMADEVAGRPEAARLGMGASEGASGPRLIPAWLKALIMPRHPEAYRNEKNSRVVM